MKKINLILAALCFSFPVMAAEEEAAALVIPEPGIGMSTSEILIVSLLIFSIALLLVTVVLYKAFKVFYQERNNPGPLVKHEDPKALSYEEWLKARKGKPNFWTKILSLRPIEEEKDMVIPHEYDGIRELNNPVPGWFNVLFYGTIIFGVFYLYYYYVADGPNQDREYVTEVEKAAKDKIAYLSKSAEKYDENSVKVDASMIENGSKVYMANCTACHGDVGQGIVGPNLTDEFWLHGGSINDIFKTIKYGVLEKGMTSWEKSLTSKQIAEVSNYILSLQGSNPAGAKAPQGEKYVAGGAGLDSLKNE